MKSQAIILETKINAPAERCFLLSLSVDLHRKSVEWSKEEAVRGITSGLMKAGDTVTWRAKHFGIYMEMTTKIPVYERPAYFVSEMLSGPFKRIYHQHYFKAEGSSTIMTDHFDFESPLGILGKLVDRLILRNYMKNLLLKRNETIKTIAESEDWKNYLT